VWQRDTASVTDTQNVTETVSVTKRGHASAMFQAQRVRTKAMDAVAQVRMVNLTVYIHTVRIWLVRLYNYILSVYLHTYIAVDRALCSFPAYTSKASPFQLLCCLFCSLARKRQHLHPHHTRTLTEETHPHPHPHLHPHPHRRNTPTPTSTSHTCTQKPTQRYYPHPHPHPRTHTD